MPRVTVIIPTYNWSTVLPYSIGSVLRQTFSDWELLVVGDACTDDSAEVVERVKREYPDQERAVRVRWINLPENVGNQSGPNNEGLRQAQGELVAYLGHDDVWLPHHLACLVQAIDSEKSADAVYSLARYIYPAEKGVPKSQPWILADRLMDSSTFLHRKTMTEALGGWRDARQLKVWTAVDLWQRARAAQFQLEFVPRLTVIKFPATLRRNVYQERPCHEQAAWLARIESEDDLETSQLTELLLETQQTLLARNGPLASQYAALLFRETPKRLRDKLKQWLIPPERDGIYMEKSREFRGLKRRF